MTGRLRPVIPSSWRQAKIRHIHYSSYIETFRIALLRTVLYFDLPKTALVATSNSEAMARIAAACRHGGFVLHQVPTAADATGFMTATSPSIVLIDTSAHFGKAIAWLEGIRSDYRTARSAVILTADEVNADDAVAALDAGADDYVSHCGSMPELVARIRAITRCRNPELASDEIAFGPLIVRPLEREVMAPAKGAMRRLQIGPTEFRLLHFLVTHPETVHSRVAIRCRLWPAEQSISERTVDASVRRLRGSLMPVGLDSMVETVLRNGYRMALPEAV